MNRYPIWKYLVIAVALVTAVIYPIPNFFPEVPAVQVSTNKSNIRIDESTVKAIDDALKTDSVPHKDITLDPPGVKVRFDDPDAQLKGKESINKRLNPDPKLASYIVAL